MPEKLHDCVRDVKKTGKSEDSSWAICSDAMKEVVDAMAIAGVKEHHNPLDIPFGHEVDEGGVGSGIKGHLADVGQKVADYAPDVVSHGMDILSGMGMTEGGIGSGRKAKGSPVRDPFPSPTVKAPRSPKAHPALPQRAKKMPMTETCTPCEMNKRLYNDIINSKLT